MPLATLSVVPDHAVTGPAAIGPVGRECTATELVSIAHQLAVQGELWHPHVRHDARQRTYHEIARGDAFSAWLICWSPGHDTGFHDHDGSAGVGLVLRGEVIESRLTVAGRPVERRLGRGQHFEFAAHDIHRVRHAGDEPSVSLHVYSPVLTRMGSYEIDDAGVLRRRTQDESEELRPRGA